jgi:RNA polymerase sigma-70 factor (ECF subfamily)
MTKADEESRIKPSPRRTRNVSEAITDPDSVLMLRVQSGNMDAFDTLVEKYKQPIVSFATRTLGDAMEAQDVAQNAFVLVFKARGRFRFACRFSTWLYTIARNLCRNEIRRRSRNRVASGVDSLRHEAVERREFLRWQWNTAKLGNVPEAVFQRELREKIDQLLKRLSERERTAILLLQDEDFSYADVAAVLGTSLAATKTLIHRGRKTLKQELRRYLRSGDWRESWAKAFAQ